ncbi:EF-P 5-aminopentanol modification-associated protein YfmH [Bacillus cereus]|uniref:Zinc protease, insulinase family n=1 Tax=Bacillus cereus (strain 03BB102) TaxID=572264 RepID=A0A158RJ02_BACC3|nr:pitrilysin family protein [Bacillus cereus]HDR7336601.1 insulinase family protein [Bacillus anthracis]ACO26973.1 zinc protease, insulinase family [Bacillus cereus 03BB102]AJG55932.1 peptidase M16 inactive domain protein [Bacillus cereus 03BB102]KXY60472.1 zinc protease [Bacillus cereus]QPR84802.1 insulinase family protein [Bacillus cereus]
MEKIVYEQLKETLYYEKLPNGLDVYILPKQGFNKTFATFTTKYGSVDNTFVPLGKEEMIRVPDGIAHFLEHKLFEKEDHDAFQLFSKQGASANAFTSFTRTAYLFSCTSNVEQNLNTLLNFVQEPYFSEKTVEKEKGIIGQEIQMYQDNPDWRLYFGLIDSLFVKHPIKIDIAGTIESISKITKDLLYECYETFYHPSNMLLFVVGAIDPEKTMDLVRENQAKKDYKNQPEIVRSFEEEPDEVNEKKKIISMPVQTPKCLVGIKATKLKEKGEALLKQEIALTLLLDYLFGKSSVHYESLYNEGLIDDSFSYDYTEENNFGFAMVGGDTKQPDELEERLKSILLNTNYNQLDEAALERVKKKKIGGFLRSLNSPEYIANQFTRYAFNESSLFDALTVLESLTVQDLQEVAQLLLSEEKMSVCQVLPKK